MNMAGMHLQNAGSGYISVDPSLAQFQNRPLADVGQAQFQNQPLAEVGQYQANVGQYQQTIIEHNEIQEDSGPSIDISINNVVCSFATRCHLNLKKIAMEGANVIYKRENGMVSMKLRNPYVTASIWSSGKITCTGATSEPAAKVAARKIARFLQKLGFRCHFSNYRVVNVLGTCAMPFKIRITNFSRDHPQHASYEPELHPGVTYKIKEPKATLKIFSTGSITVTAPCVNNVELAIQHIYPLVVDYQMEPAAAEPVVKQTKQYFSNPNVYKQQNKQRNYQRRRNFDDSDESTDEESTDDEDDDFGSD